MNDFEKEYRCKCGKLLQKGFLLTGVSSIKCSRCGEISTFLGIQKSHDNPDTFVVLFKEDNFVSVSSSLLDASGYTEDELIGKNGYDTGLFPECKKENYDHVFHNQPKMKIKTIMRKKDSSEVNVDVTSYHILMDGELHKLSFISLSDDNRSASSDISGCDFKFEIDRENKCMYVDPNISDIVGYKPEELWGTTILLGDNFHPTSENNVASQLQLNATFRLEQQVIKHKDGSDILVESIFTPLCDGFGNPEGYLCLNWLR